MKQKKPKKNHRKKVRENLSIEFSVQFQSESNSKRENPLHVSACVQWLSSSATRSTVKQNNQKPSHNLLEIASIYQTRVDQSLHRRWSEQFDPNEDGIDFISIFFICWWRSFCRINLNRYVSHLSEWTKNELKVSKWFRTANIEH